MIINEKDSPVVDPGNEEAEQPVTNDNQPRGLTVDDLLLSDGFGPDAEALLKLLSMGC